MTTEKRQPSIPEWIRVHLPGGRAYQSVQGKIKTRRLHTVCEEARCPNIRECFDSGTATFLILGGKCTRGCRFCAVPKANPHGILDEGEPERVADTIFRMGLRYVVMTSVNRDDLPDGGSGQFVRTMDAVRHRIQDILIEVLIPDYMDADLGRIIDGKPSVLAHNIEVVERLTPRVRDHRFSYRRSLAVLEQAKKLCPQQLTKSSIMLGLGESEDEIRQAMADLRVVGVDILTLGQYLQPSRKHLLVERYYTPMEFESLRDDARRIGFPYVASAPLVRSSYKAAELFVEKSLRGQGLRGQN
jgi:lipoic acid synthetase